jgi:hypothetical protein
VCQFECRRTVDWVPPRDSVMVSTSDTDVILRFLAWLP